MSETKNKLDWCLKKAQKELKGGIKHRGLVEIDPDMILARQHISKAEHYLKATSYLKEGNFSDISTSTIFYSMYHCLLAIASKFGYESRNQECTFALISYLIDENKIEFEKELLNKIYSFKTGEDFQTSTEIREQYQYGTSLTIKDDKLYTELVILAQEVLSQTKVIIEEDK